MGLDSPEPYSERYSQSTASSPVTSQSSSLVDLLDALLDKGVSARGDLIVSVAGVELLYVGLGLVVSSVATLRQAAQNSEQGNKRV